MNGDKGAKDVAIGKVLCTFLKILSNYQKRNVMRNNLRLILLPVLAMLMTVTYAQKTVTLDFDNDYKTLFPTLTGTSSGSNENYVSDGDFTEATVSAPVGGVMVALSPDEDAKNPDRIWTSSPRLRMYSGMFTVMSVGEKITKIEFVCKDKFNLTPISGTLTDKVWTGSEQNVIFTVGGNTQLSSIVVTLGGEGGSVDPADPDDEYGSEIEFTWGEFTDNGNQLAFDFRGVYKELGEQKNIEVTGQMLLNFENDLCTGGTISVTFPSEELAQIAYQEALQNADEEDKEIITINGKTVSSTIADDYIGYSKLVIRCMLTYFFIDDKGGYGTLESPMSTIQANILAGTLQKDEVTNENYYIKGKIAAIKYEFDVEHGTATFFISSDGKNDLTFQCYCVNNLENKPWVEGNTQIKVGDEVIICGKLTNFKGTTPQTAKKEAYIYSLNGVTKGEGGDTPDPGVTQKSVAEALAIINTLEDGKTTTEEYQVKGFVVGAPDFQRKKDGSLYGNVNLTIADEKGGSPTLTIFRANSFEGKSFTEDDLNLIKENDEVVFQGKLQKYVNKNGEMTPELAQGGYLISVESGSAETKGDANGDNVVNAADIVELVNYIMGSPSDKFNESAADVNGDGVVNAADIVGIVNVIMGVSNDDEKPGIISGEGDTGDLG